MRFDVVIGNPPYVRAEIIDNKSCLETKYSSYHGNADLYVFFFEQSLNILKNLGFLSFIAPNKWIQSNYGQNLRQNISKFDFIELIDFGEANIFEGVGTFPSIPTIRKQQPSDVLNYCEVTDLSLIKSANLHFLPFSIISQSVLKKPSWILKTIDLGNLIKKLEERSINLSEVFDNKFFAGIKTGSNKLFIFNSKEVETITKNSEKEKMLFRKICFGKE